MKKTYWKLFVIYLSLKWCFKVNLGDWVYYKNEKHVVCNGVRYGMWRLNLGNTSEEGWVKRSECRKVWSIENVTHSFKSGYSFYMGNWHEIWCREGILPWMKGCNIW